MAQQLVTEWRDDVEGGDADETIQFAFDGVTYEIDVNTANATKMREQLRYWAEKGRRTGGRAKPGTAAAPKAKAKDTQPQPAVSTTPDMGPAGGGEEYFPADPVDTTAVREWARQRGIEVKAHGRLSKTVLQAYQAEH